MNLKRKDRHTAYYTYMAPFLDIGNEKAISDAKKEYRRKYKAEWRKVKRSNAKEITTTWEKPEYRILKEEAGRHTESVTQFIKKTTIAYMDKRFVIPNQAQVTKVIQLLALTYNSIGELYDDGLIAKEVERKAQLEITQLEHDIRVLLFSPKTIEQVIKEHILDKPKIKTSLIAFIENLQQ